MSLKRQNTSSPEPEDDERPIKRQRPSWVDEFDTFEHPTGREEPRFNASSGQKSAFPGLDDEDDELIYGDPEDGLQYLRMVRSERKNVPHILVAERETQTLLVKDDDEQYELDDEYYHPDRAWIAAPSESLREVLDNAPDAQDLYYVSLLERFAKLQASLRTPSPLSAIELLTSSQPISFPPEVPKARDKWRQVTLKDDPVPTQIASMDSVSVMELVKLLTEGMTGTIKSRVRSRVKRLGGWIWAALARCRDRGELSSEEIAELRELGKKAVQLLDFVKRTKTAEVEDVLDSYHEVAIELDQEEPPGVKTGEDSELEKAKAHVASMIEVTGDDCLVQGVKESTVDVIEEPVEMDGNQQIRMVLDMVITIVGEVYGQRDLLEHRDIWE